MNFKSKNGRKRSFSYETKASIHLSYWVDWIFDAKTLKAKRLLCKSMFVPIERQPFNSKNGRKRSFFHESKALIHLSQQGEWICVA